MDWLSTESVRPRLGLPSALGGCEYKNPRRAGSAAGRAGPATGNFGRTDIFSSTPNYPWETWVVKEPCDWFFFSKKKLAEGGTCDVGAALSDSAPGITVAKSAAGRARPSPRSISMRCTTYLLHQPPPRYQSPWCPLHAGTSGSALLTGLTVYRTEHSAVPSG